jgi:hypothetical protein
MLGDVVFGEDGSGGVLGSVFDKFFGGLLAGLYPFLIFENKTQGA